MALMDICVALRSRWATVDVSGDGCWLLAIGVEEGGMVC